MHWQTSGRPFENVYISSPPLSSFDIPTPLGVVRVWDFGIRAVGVKPWNEG